MDINERTSLHHNGVPRNVFPATTRLERSLLVCLMVAVAIGIGLSIALASYYRKGHWHLQHEGLNGSRICYSKECVSAASSLLKSMDLNVDPCDDFYSFVCGNWIKSSYVVGSRETQFTRLATTIFLRVKEILETLQTQKELPENKQKVKDFYEACMNKNQRNKEGVKPLLEDLKNFGGWPLIDKSWDAANFSWDELMVQFFRNGYINNMLLTISVDMDFKNTSTSLISVGQPSLALNRAYYVIPHEEVLDGYKSLICKLAEKLNPELDTFSCIKDVENAFEIESRLANASEDKLNIKYAANYYNILTLEEIEEFAPKIPWRKLLKELLSLDDDLPADERILVSVPLVLKALNDILEELDNKEGKKILANYMLYRAVYFAAHHLSRDLYLLVNDFLDREDEGPRAQWEMCIKYTMESFHASLTGSYAAKYMDKTTKDLLEMMFKDLRDALTDEIKTSQWLDAETKEYALEKVKKIRKAIAYQDEILDEEKLNDYYKEIHIGLDHFDNVKSVRAFYLEESMKGLQEKRARFRWSDIHSFLAANAFYQPGQNSIIIPIGLLQDTIFASGRPDYINYGSLGMIVGHELTHAFDSIGSLYDAEGNYRMWWSNTSWYKFQDRAKCYINQYDKYYEPAVKANVNGTLTIGENIADNEGLRIAYYAYNKLLKRTASEKMLPGLPYTNKQMFWIAFTSVWCRKQTKESFLYTMKHSQHTAAKFRITGSLSNMKEFSDDFKCTLGSPLHPQSRCSLWK